MDRRVYVPFNIPLEFFITSEDVIHSWAMPSLGNKVDAIPGRLNIIRCFFHRPGIFYGQCSEICGANHRFIPIVVEAVSLKD